MVDIPFRSLRGKCLYAIRIKYVDFFTRMGNCINSEDHCVLTQLFKVRIVVFFVHLGHLADLIMAQRCRYGLCKYNHLINAQHQYDISANIKLNRGELKCSKQYDRLHDYG